MSMIKIVTPESLETEQPTIQLVKMASAGLTGYDLRAFQKRGAAEDLLKQATSLRDKVASDETLIHLIAMGSTSSTGPNRNGDGFRSEVLRQYHPTFVKHAHFYRDHKNTDPLKSYGRVVTSAYNEPMQRVELLVALSNNKEAAARNRGLIADKELTKLASGLPLPVSMACSVNHDLCSYCGNKAPTVASYCSGTYEGGHCKAGGLRHNIGSLIEIDNGIHHLHADNPHPNFFDISHVTRPADRIAYVTGRLKTASASTVIKSAELAAAMCLQVPLDLRLATTTSKVASDQLRHLYMLAEQERMAADGAYAISPSHALAFTKVAQQEDTPLPPLKDFQYKVASVMRALADDRNLLPISRFIELFTATPIEKTAELATLTQLAVPGAYNRLVQSDNCEQQLHNNPYLPAKTASASDREWSHQLVPQFSVKESVLRSRVQRSALHGCLDPEFITEAAGSVKLASVAGTEAIHSLAEQYCLYKLAFLQAVPETELPLTVALTIMQNYSA